MSKGPTITGDSDARNIIYCLHHPSSERIYVGQSSRGLRRPREHFWKNVLRPKTPRSDWVKALIARGHIPEIAVLEDCQHRSLLDEAERYYIAYFLSLGIPLLNLNDGGGGNKGYKLSAVGRARISEGQRRYWATDGVREQKRNEMLGTKRSDKTRKRMSIAALRHFRSAEAREVLSRSIKNACSRIEVKKRRSEAAKLRWLSPGYRQKQIAAQRASHGTTQARASQSARTRQAWATDSYRSNALRGISNKNKSFYKSQNWLDKQSAVQLIAQNRDDVRENKSRAALRAWARKKRTS
jgi:hypothetical protein